MQLFDSKTFNPEVFGKYVETVPRTNLNALLSSGAVKGDARLTALFAPQTGSYKGTLPMFGRISKQTVNYDGQTDIAQGKSETFSQQFVVIGRADSWTEKDFSADITGGVKFMQNIVAPQVSEYWEDIYQGGLLSVLKGAFAMTGTGNIDFVTNHTHDISAVGDGLFSVTTLNTALQKASGDRKSKFALAIMHSQVATNLENLKLLEYLKYTDKDGVTRDLTLATLNGRTVIIDDQMPYDGTAKTYTTYTFGEGALTLQDVGAEVPYEMSRDPKTNGGEDTLYSRRRFVIQPFGISFEGTTASLSPTDTELETGAKWSLVNNGKTGADKKFFPHKLIPIARIITKG